jgi:hypothetical protein
MPSISKKHTFVALAVSILLITGGFNTGKSKTNFAKKGAFNIEKAPSIKTDSPGENFDIFLKKFENNPVFQLSRIKFPLKFTALGEEGSDDQTKFIAKKDWRYANHKSQKTEQWIFKKNTSNKKEISVQFMIEDTGVSITCFFVNKNGKWWLTFVKDESD